MGRAYPSHKRSTGTMETKKCYLVCYKGYPCKAFTLEEHAYREICDDILACNGAPLPASAASFLTLYEQKHYAQAYEAALSCKDLKFRGGVTWVSLDYSSYRD